MQRQFGEGPWVRYEQDSPSETWTLAFAAAGNVELTPGLYPNANNSTADPANPYMSINANGFACGTTDTGGWFDVDQMIYDWWGKPILDLR
jgi:hypothetical protein